MGNSADAHLFFGSPVEPTEDEDENDWEWEDAYAAAKGVVRPTQEYSENDPAFPAYWDAKRDLLAAEPCALHYAGTYDDSFWFVYLKASKTQAEQGPPVPVITQEVTPDQIIELVKFCQLMKISHGTFGWHLAAFYG